MKRPTIYQSDSVSLLLKETLKRDIVWRLALKELKKIIRKRASIRNAGGGDGGSKNIADVGRISMKRGKKLKGADARRSIGDTKLPLPK